MPPPTTVIHLSYTLDSGTWENYHHPNILTIHISQCGPDSAATSSSPFILQFSVTTSNESPYEENFHLLQFLDTLTYTQHL